MIFLIDSGSSRIKWACLDTSQQPAQFHHAGDLPWSSIDMATQIEQAWQHLPQPDQIIAANVSGTAAADTLNAAALKCWPSCRAQQANIPWVKSQTHYKDLINGYENPDNLGVDRWLALIGARQITQDACCIIDCGTAITLDAISSQGNHLGGLIAPGLATMHTALASRTHHLEAHMETNQQPATSRPTDAPIKQQADYLANNTHDAIVNGISSALIALIDDFIKKMTEREGKTPLCFITGGDAPNLIPLLSHPCQHEPLLVLKGLACMAEQTP